jgi:putative hydrolase of the HAD superfamily
MMFPEAVIRAVLTDVGNVVFPIHDGRCSCILSRLTGYDPGELQRMLRIGPHVSARVDSGFWSMRDVYDCALASIHRYCSWEQFRDAWLSLLGEDFPEVREAYEALPAEIPLYTLTNTNDLHLEVLREHWLYGRSRTFWPSCEIRMAKPRPDVYTWVIKQISLHPSEILYFDDDAENCRIGQQMGMSAVQVTSPRVVPDTLRELSVLTV